MELALGFLVYGKRMASVPQAYGYASGRGRWFNKLLRIPIRRDLSIFGKLKGLKNRLFCLPFEAFNPNRACKPRTT